MYSPCPKTKPENKGYQTYQLVQVPSTDGHVALVLIQALAEVLHVGRAGRVLPGRGAVALVEAAFHGLSLGSSSLLGFGGGARGATAEEAADGVADGGTNCDTTIGFVSFYSHCSLN
jgi:hypothetical protein